MDARATMRNAVGPSGLVPVLPGWENTHAKRTTGEPGQLASSPNALAHASPCVSYTHVHRGAELRCWTPLK